MEQLPKLKYKRILLKLSGEVLKNREKGDCIDADRLAFMAERVRRSTRSVARWGSCWAAATSSVAFPARRTA